MATRKTDPPSTTRRRAPKTSTASSAVDEQLARYRSMRDFHLTDEPSGSDTNTVSLRRPTVSRGLPFVIQKHDASHLHYDFRLAWRGLLKSWAVAKGPSYNPQERRLAVEVEDHPLEYGGFEGIIPQGQYGGGTVMIWDQGNWWPQLGSENVEACLRSGHLKFEMNGAKMKGKWALIRMNNHATNEADASAKPHWLLIKEHDKYERGPADPAITDERPNSAITGRSIPQIAAAQDHVWAAVNPAPGPKQESPQPKHPKHPAPRPRVSLHPETLQKFSLSATKPGSRPIAAPATRRLTHPDKILDPETDLTKQQLADYYAAVADRMFPHIADRPLSLVRCPDGTAKPCFFQKHINTALPPGIRTIAITDKTSAQPEPYITLDSPQAILSFAQFDALEIHPWACTNHHLEHPDRLIFDLDPDPTLPWLTLAAAAAEVRQRLKNAGLESFLKLTGGNGLHIVAPIEPTITWAELKAAARALVLSMQRDNPALYLTKMTKSSRNGKIFLDYLRNQRGATAVAPYSPRANSGAHVSLPLPWSALNHPTHPVFSVHNLNSWRSRLRTDPWKSLLTTQQQLHPFHFAAL